MISFGTFILVVFNVFNHISFKFFSLLSSTMMVLSSRIRVWLNKKSNFWNYFSCYGNLKVLQYTIHYQKVSSTTQDFERSFVPKMYSYLHHNLLQQGKQIWRWFAFGLRLYSSLVLGPQRVFYIFSNNFESHSIYLFVDVCFCSFFYNYCFLLFFWLPCNYYNKLISIEYLIYWHLLLLWWWPSFHFRNGTQIVVLDDHASIKLFSALNIFFIMGCLVKHAQTQHKSHIIRPL